MRADMNTFTFGWDELAPAPEEVCRAMGYRGGVPEPVSLSVREALSECVACFEIRAGYGVVGEAGVDGDRVVAGEAAFHVGEVIARQLRGSSSIAVFAATAGPRPERRSKELMQRGELMKGYALDTIASEVVERAADLIQARLGTARPGEGVTNRFSPGYCGWPVSDQHALFSLLPPDYCGISLTETALMLPIKSVSGIIGVGPRAKTGPYPCSLCTMTNCYKRNTRKARR